MHRLAAFLTALRRSRAERASAAGLTALLPVWHVGGSAVTTIHR
ncbi:hypothetical protein [Ornithinimicrobium pekingense]|uniref:Uncharacterized protein n=1 Tax=Ornithinimicrobium pekingense TaxID=384677 RepID=A0ABQ2FDE6_9MICO|nr:hypothetical protein [Ornithinimicrobium pekingense]GGK78137.1 hypothetical protein GCM10011509_28340 [Ornithinimicrobium pekingense]